ncbi:MAG: endonuclease [Gammaproteobacteria bacterium]|nr:endonuclease [Gammaproteobacteria bacterium]
MLSKEVLMTLYDRLFQAYGPQKWWPAETAFEVMVGAVLTQNTAWGNVEKAIANLKQAGQLDMEAIHRLGHERLAELIRPAGYFNVKARRLKNLCAWLLSQGGLDSLQEFPTDTLRQALLSVNGIGPETADDILLYAFVRPVFVIDSYTRRLLKKLTLLNVTDVDYEELRHCFETALDPDPVMFNEYHALIVRHAKQKCTDQTDCKHCLVEEPITN